jgi:hypothetical protein
VLRVVSRARRAGRSVRQGLASAGTWGQLALSRSRPPRSLSSGSADARWAGLLAAHGLPGERAQFVALVSLAQLVAFFGSVLLFELVVPRLPGARRWKLEHGPPPPGAELVRKPRARPSRRTC